MKIYVATINHEHGVNHYAAKTKEGLLTQIADYCREWWKKGGPTEPAPEGDQEIIDAYFGWIDEIGGYKWSDTSEVELGE
jgi:hypothetical protein